MQGERQQRGEILSWGLQDWGVSGGFWGTDRGSAHPGPAGAPWILGVEALMEFLKDLGAAGLMGVQRVLGTAGLRGSCGSCAAAVSLGLCSDFP